MCEEHSAFLVLPCVRSCAPLVPKAVGMETVETGRGSSPWALGSAFPGILC